MIMPFLYINIHRKHLKELILNMEEKKYNLSIIKHHKNMIKNIKVNGFPSMAHVKLYVFGVKHIKNDKI